MTKISQILTVEPVMLFYVTSSMMATLTTENLNLEKACLVNIGFNESICEAMVIRNRSAYTSDQEIQVQKLVTSLLIYKTAIQGTIPFMLMLFLGSWSDRHKRRKPFILLPICGDIISTLGYIFCVYFFLELPVEVAIFFESVPVAVTGTWFFFFVGVYSYVSEKSNEDTRTISVGVATVFTHVSLTSGIALSGVVYKILGFYGAYSLSLLMFAIALTYGSIFLKDSQSSTQLSPKKNFLSDIFDYHNVANTFSVCMDKKRSKGRLEVGLVLVLVLLIVGPGKGKLAVMYMFTRRKFGWSEIDFSGFNTYNSIVHMIGVGKIVSITCFVSSDTNLSTKLRYFKDALSQIFTYTMTSSGATFCLMVFVKWMKIDDTSLGMIAMASSVVGCIASAFATTPLQFYLASLTEIFDGSSHIALRSIMSKLVDSDELGKMLCLFGLCEALTPLLCGSLFSYVYHETIDKFPGAFFFVSACLYTGAFLIFSWLYFLRKDANDRKSTVMQDETAQMFEGSTNS